MGGETNISRNKKNFVTRKSPFVIDLGKLNKTQRLVGQKGELD